ncbi:MAG: hypothetical protein LUQ26_00860 [Methylococcaceae bacterium]|nr:hypothetical protein [Methylococcaceae bacterium]
MEKIFLTIPILLVALVFSGCSEDTTEEPNQILEFATVDNSKRSDITEQRFVVIKDAAAWNALWTEHAGNDPGRPIPPINFLKEMVLGVFLGTRGNNCFSVKIESVEQVAHKQLIVKYRELKSGPVCSPAETQPLHLISLSSSALPVEFVAQQ